MADATNTYNEGLDLITVDPEELRVGLLTMLEEGVGEALYPGDERRIYGEALVAVLMSLYFVVNDSVRQSLLAFARGQVLDAIGERVNAHRLEGIKAKTILRFSMTEARDVNTYIPQWTKVAAGDYYFATDEETVIPAGAYYVDVVASALEPGSAYNGILAGSITTIIDQIAYVSGVTNTSETVGGEDGEPYTVDGDNAYRERIRLAPEAFSVAGPKGAYEYWTKTADAGIIDSIAITPTVDMEQIACVNDGAVVLYIDGVHLATLEVYPHGGETAAVYGEDYTLLYSGGKLTLEIAEDGALAGAEMLDLKGKRDLAGHVMIYVLMTGAQLPTAAQCESIREVVAADNIRPMNDYVEVHAPERVEYDLDVTYYTNGANAAAVLSTVEGESGAVARYTEWQGTKIGRSINPDELRKYILKPDWSDAAVGAYRVEITSPEYTELAENQVAVLRNLTVNRIVE